MWKIIDLDIDAALSADTGVWEVAWVNMPAIEQELIYFGRQKFYKAPEYVSNKACQAIRENEKRGNPAGTQVGKVRAQQLCNRSEISLETIKRMKSFLERAATYNSGNWDDNGTIAYGLWGGEEALTWVNKILRSLENQDMAELEDACWEGYEPIGTKMLNGREVPNCVPIEQSKQEFVYPSASETKDEFISRCIPFVIKEGKTPEQAAGQCYGMWENRKFAIGDRIGFEWEVLKTGEGLNLFKNELRRATLPVLFIQGLPTQELIDFTNKYQIPVSAINMYGSRGEKIKLIKDMGLKRHYDNDPFVRKELGSVAIDFDYVLNLPSYESTSGDTMETKPVLPPVLFNEDCGCMKSEEFAPYPWNECISDQLERGYSQEVAEKICGKIKAMNNSAEEFGLIGYIDGQPIFSTKEEAEEYGSSQLGCDGSHEHTDEDGNKVYMPCEIHSDAVVLGDYTFNISDGYSEEELEVVKLLQEVYKTSPQEFERITGALQGSTKEEVIRRNHKNPTNYFQYARKLDGFPDRDFCISIENRYFRRMEIDVLRDTNMDFGHNGAGYSKWLYKGGPQCVHAWRKYIVQEGNFADQGYAEGKAGMAPQEMPGKGYYPGTPRYQANLSKQDVELTGELLPLYWNDGLPLYSDPIQASDASYLLGCGGVYETVQHTGQWLFQACSTNMKKQDVDKSQMFSMLEEKRMVYMPLMIPNILIPRMDETTGERYFVRFKPETIEKIRDKFMSELRNRETNLEHSDKKFKDAVMVESWIVTSENDKVYDLGFTKEQIPLGTWFAGYKILDTEEGNELWTKYIKTNKVKGGSVEGNFLLNFSRQKTDEYLLEQIINIIKQTI